MCAPTVPGMFGMDAGGTALEESFVRGGCCLFQTYIFGVEATPPSKQIKVLKQHPLQLERQAETIRVPIEAPRLRQDWSQVKLGEFIWIQLDLRLSHFASARFPAPSLT